MPSIRNRSLWWPLAKALIIYTSFSSFCIQDHYAMYAYAAPIPLSTPHHLVDHSQPLDAQAMAFGAMRSKVASVVQPYDNITPLSSPPQRPNTTQRNTLTIHKQSNKVHQKSEGQDHARGQGSTGGGSIRNTSRKPSKYSKQKTTMKTEVKNTPVIFYVPHQDDDALAMALGIREHIVAGRPVYVHLYSDGINAPLRDIVNGNLPCPLHKTPHHFNLTLDDVVVGRTHEFRQSLHALGVPPDHIFETGWSDLEPLQDYNRFKAKLRSLIISYENMFPGASHKCISGEYDKDAVGRNPTHRACWDVARDLIDEYPGGWPPSKSYWDFRFYRTYIYYKTPEKRAAQFIWSMPEHLAYKRLALDQYKQWDPKRGELAWGYHSVKTLIDAAYNDAHVYMDMLDNDPTNPNYDEFLRKEILQSPFSPIWRSKTHRLQALKSKHVIHSTNASSRSHKGHSSLVQQQDGQSIDSHSSASETQMVQGQSTQLPNANMGTSLEEAEQQEMENILKTYENLQKTQGVTGYTYWDRLNESSLRKKTG